MADIKVKIYKASQIVFRQEEMGDLAFLVKSGSVEIFKRDKNDKEVQIAIVGKGGMFGEMALIENRPRMASARAMDDGTELIVVTKSMFDSKMNKADPFIRGMLNILADHVRKMSN